MPDKVPLWIIRNTFTSYGSKMPGRPPLMGTDLEICATCQKEMYSFKDWTWVDGKYYCDAHVEAARAEDRERWAKKYGRETTGRQETTFRAWREDSDDRVGFDYMTPEFGAKRIPRTESEIPIGNLTENDYAFWIGTLERYSGGAKSLRSTCRACNQNVWGDSGRVSHIFVSKGFYQDQLSCAKVLALSYQQLLKQDECLVCKSKCYGKQKWGVPLCCPNCIKLWKFDETIEYETLERTMMQYWKGLDETKIVRGGSTTSVSSSNQTSTASQEETTE